MINRQWCVWLWVAEIAVVIVLSLIPARLVPETTTNGISGMPQHATAYVALVLVPAVVFKKRRAMLQAAAGLVLMGAVLEMCQLGIPGRSFEWRDIAVNATGAALGLLTGLSIRSRMQKWLV